MNFADVSVVVSTYNRPKALHLVLDGLSRQKLRPSQIVIGDDGSRSETAYVIEGWRSRGLPVEHCWHEDLGFRKTIILNRALQRVKNPYTIFLDGDCIPLDHFVEDHIVFSGHGRLLAGSRILASEAFTHELESGAENCLGRPLRYWLVKKTMSATNRWMPRVRFPDGPWRNIRALDWRAVRGCNFSAPTRDLIATGGFDEKILGWGREDSELAVRLINSGVRVKLLGYAGLVLHLWHPEESRYKLADNDSWLSQSIAERRTKARVGLQPFLFESPHSTWTE